MLSLKDIFPMVDFDPPWQKLGSISDTVLLRLSESMPGSSCSSDELEASCRDDSAALTLKLVSIACILIAGAAGISLPLLGKERKFLRTDSNMFVAAKAFAAGVILATGFVHMLPDGFSSLTDSCLPEYPWSDFPFAGFFAMCSALVTLLADFVGTQVYERRQQQKGSRSNRVGDSGRVDLDQIPISMAVMEKEVDGESGDGRKVFGEEDNGGMHIVGIHAHVAHHRHSHPPGQKGCEGHVIQVLSDPSAQGRSHGHTPVEENIVDDSDHGDLGHSHMDGGSGEEEGGSRHVVVSQVLELGIVSHSVIIGLSLGVSHSPCTIRPLLGALCFHQFFEGFALGGCISDAQFSTLSTVIMACFFALTTPLGVAVGIGIASSYNSSSARALIIEGVLDSISAGILIYMSLVDLIAADFMSKRMRCNFRLQVMSYLALFLGAGLMSLLAIWA